MSKCYLSASITLSVATSKKEVEQTYGSEIGGLLSSTDVRTLVAIVTIE